MAGHMRVRGDHTFRKLDIGDVVEVEFSDSRPFGNGQK